MTLIVETLKRCLERAAMSPARMLRSMLAGFRVDGASSGEGDPDVRDCHCLKHSLDDIPNITA